MNNTALRIYPVILLILAAIVGISNCYAQAVGRDRALIALIPAQTLAVLPGSQSATSVVKPAQNTQGYHEWLGWGFALLALFGVLIYLWRKHWAAPSPKSALLAAIKDGSSQRAATALLAWAASRWAHDPPRSLAALIARLDADWPALRELDRALYSDSKLPWNGADLLRAVERGLMDHNRPKKRFATTALPPLYPVRARKSST